MRSANATCVLCGPLTCNKTNLTCTRLAKSLRQSEIDANGWWLTFFIQASYKRKKYYLRLKRKIRTAQLYYPPIRVRACLSNKVADWNSCSFVRSIVLLFESQQRQKTAKTRPDISRQKCFFFKIWILTKIVRTARKKIDIISDFLCCSHRFPHLMQLLNIPFEYSIMRSRLLTQIEVDSFQHPFLDLRIYFDHESNFQMGPE